MKDKVSVDGVRKEKERLTTDHQPIPGPYLSFLLVVEKWKKKGRDPGNDQKKVLLLEQTSVR